MAALGWILVYVHVTVLNGFALQVLWGWFVVDIFSIKAITIPQALGISMVVSFLTKQYIKDERSTGEQLLYSFIAPIIALVFGWVIHLFV